MKLLKPNEPKPPIKPIIPQEFYIIEKDVELYSVDLKFDSNGINLDQLELYLPDNIKLKDLKIRFSNCYDCHSFVIFTNEKVKNHNYEYMLEDYNKKLKKYDKDYLEYEIKLKKYSEDIKIFAKNKIKDLEDQVSELKKELNES